MISTREDVLDLKPDLLSILIGVNNEVRGVPLDQYEQVCDEIIIQRKAMQSDLFMRLAVAILLLGVTASEAASPVTQPERVLLPDGTFFAFWDDRTVYSKTYHVAGRNPKASDENPGTEEKPFKTISRAAQIVGPGEKVVVHEGIYRECVSPARGGSGPDRMIAYEAAAGEKVVVSGAMEWRPHCRPSAGWQLPQGAKTIWTTDLPVEAFAGYSPFLARNMYDEFVEDRNLDEAPKYLLRRGNVFVDGRPLKQVFRFVELASQDGAFWVEEPGLRIHFRLRGDADPGKAAFEVTAREQVFAPLQRGLGYVRVSGCEFVDGTLIEDNLVERIGGLDIERMWEVAGLKLHIAKRVLIRGNHFRDLHHSAGVWLDCLNENCRVMGNVFRNITTCNGTLFVEVSHAANVLDHYFFWDIRRRFNEPGHPKDGSAVCADSSDHTVAAYNFFGHVGGFAVSMNNVPAERVEGGRKGECRGNQVLNNIFFACPYRVFLGRNEGNLCDGNLYDAGEGGGLFDIQTPAPRPKPRLDAWQKTFGKDRRSVEAPMTAAFDLGTNQLRFACRKGPESCVPVAILGETASASGPGPLRAQTWKLLREGKPQVLSVPER